MVKILLFIGFQYLVHCLIHYELMWVKQCHKPSPSHPNLLGGMVTIPKWVVYDTVLPTLLELQGTTW